MSLVIREIETKTIITCTRQAKTKDWRTMSTPVHQQEKLIRPLLKTIQYVSGILLLCTNHTKLGDLMTQFLWVSKGLVGQLHNHSFSHRGTPRGWDQGTGWGLSSCCLRAPPCHLSTQVIRLSSQQGRLRPQGSQGTYMEA